MQTIIPRSVHLALAKTVDTSGSDLARDLYAAAQRFNAEFFGGTLLPVAVMVAAPASPAALASHAPMTPEGIECLVKISPVVAMASKELAHDALLHEMIHVWQTETDNSEPGYEGHGPKFAAKCNEIGAKLGLPEVGVKGRGGLPNCAQWPLNVRPAGYYGEVIPKAAARATKTRTSAAGVGRVPGAKKTKKGKRPNWKALAKKYRAQLKALTADKA
jgi:hypothetical protein